MKVLLPEYKALETRLDKRLRAQFKLPEKISDGVKQADYIALFVEATTLIPTGGKDWPAPEGIKERANEYIKQFGPPPSFYSSDTAERVFRIHFDIYQYPEATYA